MRYLSLCSGIEAATAAWHPLGWTPVAFAEIEPFPSAVLAHHYPDVPNWGDITKFREWPDAAIDVLVGGTPCQSFSVAGLRKGLADPRGNLALTYLAIADRYRPDWLVWENVPGVLSSDEGRDFGAFLGGLAELGYGFAYRVLDAQYARVDGFPFAVPQRRRRVFVVGHSGDWRRAAAVLFERESLSGDSPPRRKAGQGIAASPSASPSASRSPNEDATLVPTVANVLTRRMHKGINTTLDEGQTLVAHSLKADGFDASEDGTGRGTPLVVAHTIQTQCGNVTEDGTGRGSPLVPIAFSAKDHGADAMDDLSPTLRAGGHHNSHANAGVMPAIAFQQENKDADAYEADASSALSTLRKTVGEEAFQQWGLAILTAFQSPEILRQWLHGAVLRIATEESRCRLDGLPFEGKEDSASIVLRKLWFDGPDGRTSQGRGLAKQLAGKSGEAMSVLPHEGAQQEAGLSDLRSAHEGARLLREALSALQGMGRPSGSEGKPASTAWAVRRLTPREAARLQGFPDDYLDITFRGKAAADGPRYKALGNSMAVNVMRWVGSRIALVEALGAEIESREAAE